MQLIRRRLQVVRIWTQLLSSSAKVTSTDKEGDRQRMKTRNHRIVRAAAVAAAAVLITVIVGSVIMGGYVADRIHHQNEGKNTHENSLRQLGLWGYDPEAFEAAYAGIGREISAAAKDGNIVPGTYFDTGVTLVLSLSTVRAATESVFTLLRSSI